MLTGGSYYSLTLNASNTDHAAYYSLQPLPTQEFLQGSFQCAPTETSGTSVAIYPQVAQVQFPASSIVAGGVTIVTSDDTVGGALNVSPPVGVPVTVTLYGTGGSPIGSATLQAGASHLDFAWKVTAAQSIPLAQTREALAGVGRS